MLILGAHMSIAKGFAAAALKTGKDYDANAMQIFTKSPRGRFFKPLDPADVIIFRETCKKYSIKFVAAHSSYLLNLAKPIKEIPWIQTDLTADVERLYQLGGNGVIVHVGKKLENDTATAIKNVAENAKIIIEATAKTPVEYIIENTAGQGSEVGSNLEELGEIWKHLKNFSPRLKFCLDTAHLWGAGYDLSTEQNVQKYFTDFNQVIGLKNLACIHFNDSKKECGSKVDRHDNLGEGKIGLPGLTAIAKFAEKNSIPLIIETPEKDGGAHLRDILQVKSLLTL